MADSIKARPRKSSKAAAGGAATPTVTNEEIAARAYELSQSDVASTSEENWLRVEQALHGRSTEVAP
ncbi:MAG: hypothetical protein ABI317_00770 [Gaiellales bacterium]